MDNNFFGLGKWRGGALGERTGVCGGVEVVIVLYLFRSHRVAWINGRGVQRSDLLTGALSRSGRQVWTKRVY